MFIKLRLYKKHFLPILITLFSIFGVATYFVLTSTNEIMKSALLFWFLYADIAFLFFLIYITVRQIIRFLRYKQRHSSNGNILQKQIIILFSCVTIIPATCVFLFAVLFFNIGIEALFKAPVKATIENANQVAEIYIQETRKALENYAYGVGMQLNGVINDIMISRNNIEEILSSETSGLGIDAIVFQEIKGDAKIILAKSPFTLSLQFEDMPQDALSLDNGEVLSWESKQFVIAINVLDKNSGIYLMVSKSIDQNILDHKHKIKNAIHEYTSLATQRTVLKVTFMTFFSSMIILLLVTVILTGILFANRIMKPVNNLIYAAKNISLGNYNSPITAPKFKNELDILISSFNIMIAKLAEQRKELAISNRQNAWRDIARKIAHEIKNPLTPIQLSAERLKRKYNTQITTDREVFITCIDTIIRQVHCIGALVKEFSDFARMPEPKLENTDLAQLVRETVLLQTSSHKSINFHVNLSNSTKYLCYIDSSQITQVIMNLLQNSINAIMENKKNGNIYISLQKETENCVMLFEDDGPGFSTNALEHALDPYFTTREAGNGLGLAVVYKIIIEHEGQIELSNSTAFGGASVKIVLPSNLI